VSALFARCAAAALALVTGVVLLFVPPSGGPDVPSGAHLRAAGDADALAALRPAPPPVADDRERVELVVDGDITAVRAAVAAAGGTIEVESGGRLQARVAPAALPALVAVPGVRSDPSPAIAVPLQASSVSRGLLGVDHWREAGFTGYGTKIAVLDGGFRGYESRLGRTLPARVVARSFRSGIEPGTGTDHGTQAAEVVSSIAPGARLYLVTFGTLTELSAAVDFLIEEQVDVVSFSLGFLHSGPGDGSGPVNAIVNRGIRGGGLWTVAAGNWARVHWRGPYVDGNADSVHEFTPGTTTNGRFYQTGDLISVSLRWDDHWGASCSDFDLELFAPGGSLVRASRRTQNCAGDPVEGFQVLATETGEYSVRIVGADVRAEHTLDLLMVGSPDRGDEIRIVTPGSSLSEPADNPGVVTVGALNIAVPLGAAPFSSRGPTADGRAKPDVLSPTGGTVPSSSAFTGTSAAAPHVAGMAALLGEAVPAFGGPEIARELRTRSIDLRRGDPGAPEVIAGLGSTFGLGPLLPVGAAQARFFGSLPRGEGLALLVYAGPNGYPPRFGHLLTPNRTPLAYFRFDEATQAWDRYIVGAPARVQTLDALSSGGAYVVRFAADE
jgi:subtilisin family serine protease